MRIHDLFPRLILMSRQEQLTFIAEIRRRKHEVRPAEKKHKEKARKGKVNTAKNLLSNLSEDQIAKLLQDMENEE